MQLTCVLEMRTDKIQDVVAMIIEDVIMLCASRMSPEQVTNLIGERAQNFPLNISPDDFQKQYNYEIEVGSTSKPNSAIKKKEAIELGQVMGQFASISPMVVKKMMEVMERAFDGSRYV